MENPKSEHVTKHDEEAKPAKDKVNPSMVQPEVLDGVVAQPDKHEEQTPHKDDAPSHP